MCEDLNTLITKEFRNILKNSKSVKGPTTKYILKTTKITDGELLRKERIGEKDDKPYKVILLVGETGTGKTALTNAMINYIMGVRWEHKIWLEVSEVCNETTAVTVYEVYAQGSPFSLKIIDTPGFDDTQDTKHKVIAEGLQQLFTSEDRIHEIHAVCLVLKSSESRLHDRQLYILDKILSLFGKNLHQNILILLTNSHETISKRSLNFIKSSKIPCAKKKDNQPVCFQFNSSQSDCFDEEDRESFKPSWDLGIKNFKRFFDYLNGISPISVNMTEGVLRTRKQLNKYVNNLKNDLVKIAEHKNNIGQTKKALKKLKEYKRTMNNFEYYVHEFYEEKVPIESQWWHWSKWATRCIACEENCHYPGCWWVKDLYWCSVMTDGKCTVCSGKCDHTRHVKDNHIYAIVERKVKKVEEDIKEKYERESREKQSLLSRLEKEIKQIETEKIRLVEECYQCLERLMETALKSTSMSSFIHLDFMIEKVKETGKQERVQKLEELKKRTQEENKELIRRFLDN